MKVEGIVHDWKLVDLSVDEISDRCDKLIEKTTRDFSEIGKVKSVSYESVIEPLIHATLAFDVHQSPIDFIQHVVPNKCLREASLKASQKLSSCQIEISSSKEVFDKVMEYEKQFGLEDLKPEYKRFIEKFIIDGKRLGLHLDETTRDKVKELRKKISSLGIDFSSNLNENTSCLELTEEELAGVPEDLLKSFDKTPDGKKCIVTMKYPHFYPVMRKCRVPETRKLMDKTYGSRCIESNTQILEELIKLRHENALTLGYPNHAAFIQEVRMAKNPQTVEKFLTELRDKLQPIWKAEKELMLKMKQDEAEKFGFEFDGKFNHWDGQYYRTKVEELKYAVDKEKLREYFPIEKVTKGLFEIYQELLGFTFTLVKNAETWFEDVQLYRVDDTKSKKKMGYFFLDLYPREGKYGHACIVPIQTPCIQPDGSHQISVCAMLANFTKPTKDKPSLMSHDEVVTYFHEFGHIMHMISNTGETGLMVEIDFIESPSQMLENWCWYKTSLNRMSGHYKDGTPIPDDLLEKLIESRVANAGGFNLGQIIYATYDQRIHTRGQANTSELYRETVKEINGIDTLPDTNVPATITHMVGYAAQYYGYLWSEVFSFDMFETKFGKDGLMNPVAGMEYRNKILAPGGTKDAFDLLRDFLGREPNQDAFLKAKGLKSSS